MQVQESRRKLQATVAMKEAWEESRLTRSSRAQTEDNDGCCCDSSCCCCCCPTECRIFIKYIVCRSLGLFLYVMDIVTDITVSVADYRNGDITFAAINLGLVFTPGFLYVMFALTEMLSSNTGILACSKAVLWFLSFPILPLWPIWTETMEAVQVSFSLLTLSSKVISTYQKSVTTQQIIEGELEDNEKFTLPCCVQILAFLWWTSFLVARFEVMALFAGSLHGWLFLVIAVHVMLVFLFQTVASHKHGRERLIFVHYGAFCCGLIMMIATFCCPERKQSAKDKEVTEEMRHMSVVAS